MLVVRWEEGFVSHHLGGRGEGASATLKHKLSCNDMEGYMGWGCSATCPSCVPADIASGSHSFFHCVWKMSQDFLGYGLRSNLSPQSELVGLKPIFSSC